jgi:hypothetical protein
MKKLLLLCLGYCFVLNATAQQKMDDKALQSMKTSLNASMDKYAKDIQVMVDQIFSYSELGFQEWETSKFIISVEKRFYRRKGHFRSANRLDGQMGQWISGDCTGE